ncbi:MAG: flagellar basal body P-ring formation chaperone FlgA [Halanaerobiaceae bacterium]
MKILILLSAGLLLLVLPVAAETVEISLHGEAEVDSTRIRLDDIADIEGAGDELGDELADIQLEKAAPPGYSKKINRSLIKLLIKNSGLDYENIDFDGEQAVRVYTSSREIAAAEIEEFLRDSISSQFSDELHVQLETDIGSITLPDGKYSLEIAEEKEEISPGRNTLRLLVKSGGEVYKRVFVTCIVGIEKDVFKARRDLQRGEKVRKSDFTAGEEFVTEEGDVIDSLEEAEAGKYILRRDLKKGELLTTEYLEQPVLISRGQQVKLEVISGNIRVYAEVEALQRGKAGETIRIKNNENNRRLRAEVVSDELVRIEK